MQYDNKLSDKPGTATELLKQLEYEHSTGDKNRNVIKDRKQTADWFRLNFVTTKVRKSS